MIRTILEYIKDHPESSFPEISEGIGIEVEKWKNDFYSLKNDKYLNVISTQKSDKQGNPLFINSFRLAPKGLELLLKLSEENKRAHNKNQDFKKIFISHSFKDRKITDRIIKKLLLPIFELDKNDIFYTSNQETGIPISSNWRNKIKAQIKECPIYVALITPNFQSSSMCLNELGAAWVLDKRIYPLILPPISYSNFGLLISDLQSLDISKAVNIKSFLDSLQIDLLDLFNTSSRRSVDKEREITNFGKSLRQFLRKNPDIFKTKEFQGIDVNAKYINQIPGIEYIKDQSKKEWPNDEAMQDHFIRSQLDAFRQLAKIRNEAKNKKLIDIYIHDAEKFHLYDYVNQLNFLRSRLTN